MRINGLWHLCDDGIVRPIIRGEVLASDGTEVNTPFLVDTGADRTVFSADILKLLKLAAIESPDRLSGPGGAVDSVVVATEIRLTRDDNVKASFQGQFAGCLQYETLDMSVLGRDILGLFALIVDRPSNTISLLGNQHYYTINQR